jgi:hypothetical protein
VPQSNETAVGPSHGGGSYSVFEAPHLCVVCRWKGEVNLMHGDGLHFCPRCGAVTELVGDYA